MAFRRPARLGALAVIVASIAFPAAASGADASGGAAAPVETGPGYNVNAPSGGAAAGAVPPPAPVPKPGSSGDHKTSHKKKKKAPTWRFPVAGAHNYGGPGARFGAPRSGHTHQGQDVLAGEGTPLVAPHRGYIKYIGDQPGGAGIYIVMHASGTSYDFALMHLQPGSVRVHEGQGVKAGTRLGSVGHTGDASGPHLHFEVWVGAWQMGGHPIDPLPLLRRWDR